MLSRNLEYFVGQSTVALHLTEQIAPVGEAATVEDGVDGRFGPIGA
jgi:hypothetical protein